MKEILKEEVLFNDFRDALLSMSKLKTHFKDNELYLLKKKKRTNKQKKQEKKSEKAKGV